MDFRSLDCGALPVSANLSRFQGQSGVDEYHLTMHPTEYGSIETQLEWMLRAYQIALDSMGLGAETAVLRRFFCTDLLNHAAALEAQPFSNPRNVDEPCAVSWVCQPPIPPARVALWAYHIRDPHSELDKAQEGTSLTLKRGELSHHWTTGVTHTTSETSYEQTRGIFEQYDAFLRGRNLTIADNVLRTWFFVQDVDANYSGLVAARREFFAKHGLTPDTHFIASTGIGGTCTNVAAKVAMDAYAVSGLRPGQVEYLEALDHLSPTHVYGVTFERATSVAYRDRRHVIISGTASIDSQGNILHPGNVSRQLDRTIENIEALLKQADATLEDLCLLIAYVRDPSDHKVACQQIRERFGDAPLEVVVAPVCRPGWLVEVEGLAIIPARKPELPMF